MAEFRVSQEGCGCQRGRSHP